MTVHHTRVVALAAVLVGRLYVPAAVQESTLKGTAPVPQSPTNAEIVDSATPTLTSTTAAGRFVSGTFEHHFEVSELAVAGPRRARRVRRPVVRLGDLPTRQDPGQLDPALCRRLFHPAERSGGTLGLGRLQQPVRHHHGRPRAVVPE